MIRCIRIDMPDGNCSIAVYADNMFVFRGHNVGYSFLFNWFGNIVNYQIPYNKGKRFVSPSEEHLPNDFNWSQYDRFVWRD